MGNKRKARTIASHVHRYVNQRREKKGRTKLTGHKKLMSAAESHSRTMARTGKMAHGAGGTTPQERCSGFIGVSENVFMTQGNRQSPSSIAREAVKTWMKSPGHRKNILRKKSTFSGVGVWISGDKIYITHNFAHSRRPLIITTDIFNGLSGAISQAIILGERAGNAALALPYLPLRAIKRDWWRILPRHRQKSLTLGIILGMILGWFVTPSAIMNVPQILIEGGQSALLYYSTISMFLFSWLWIRWR